MSKMLKLVPIAFAALFVSGAALACDYCSSGYYGAREIYSCNEGRYDCRYESALYVPQIGECGYGCHGQYGGYWDDGCGCYRSYHRGFRHGYRVGFHDGYETANYDYENRGFYDDGHHWHNWERWRDGDGHWRDGWHDDKGGWHDRDFHHDGWRDGDRHDDPDWHEGDGHDWHGGDGHDGDHHDDHDGHDDHH